MIFDRFLRDNATWLSAGVLLAFSSSFGQTFFIALFAEPLRAEFSLSHGEWGGIYTVATVCSAIVLVYIGKFADTMRIRTLALVVYAGLIGLALAMVQVNSLLMLGGIIFGLRLCGQGMMTHMAITAMGRWFARRRGRAVAIASFGFPVGEAALPIIVVSLFAIVGWRQTWVIVAVVLGLVLAPAVFFLLRHERKPGDHTQEENTSGLKGRHWTRKQVLQHWFFWALIPGLLSSPFIGTAIFFHQAHIVETKGWSLVAYVLAFPFYSGAALLCSFGAGVAVDRYGPVRLLPFFLAPLTVALIILGFSQQLWMAYFYFALMGMTSGISMALLGTLWAEIYGTKNLGAVRSLTVAIMVFASALGPGLTGFLIDLGVRFEDQCYWMALYTVVMCLFVFPMIARKINHERSLG